MKTEVAVVIAKMLAYFEAEGLTPGTVDGDDEDAILRQAVVLAWTHLGAWERKYLKAYAPEET